MQSRTTRQFRRLFSDLPLAAQRDAKRAALHPPNAVDRPTIAGTNDCAQA